MQLFFETDYIIISYDKANQVLVGKWKIAPTSAEFREGMNSLIAAMEHFKTGKILTDTTYLGTIHPNDQRWSATEWKQRATKVGYSKIAIIIPADVFTQMAVEDTINQLESPLLFAYFNNTEDAIDWIK
ncbi:STAS/SEC14 domain-containing protein [Chryseolinea soli]|uniref:STAS/SEC14 domain-containing protein n=1 Tax=Chryseolinea soli TaxID=2321403 RepID=A0A385SP30_9BACT|nr:STAS/SEC14 domain-containing protein [Chryseolinea soli]AYB32037.1 hypothetical protein D4L85_16325 [Chryseolinea soli]